MKQGIQIIAFRHYENEEPEDGGYRFIIESWNKEGDLSSIQLMNAGNAKLSWKKVYGKYRIVKNVKIKYKTT